MQRDRKGDRAMPDMNHPIDTWEGAGAKAAAQRAANELRTFARSQGYDLEVRTTRRRARCYGGRVLTVATWGVFLAPLTDGQKGAQRASRKRRGARVTSS